MHRPNKMHCFNTLKYYQNSKHIFVSEINDEHEEHCEEHEAIF